MVQQQNGTIIQSVHMQSGGVACVKRHQGAVENEPVRLLQPFEG